MPRKENTKAKTWERDRRNRMNGYFKNLSDLLPPLLEGRKRNKIDILIHASKYIKELHSRSDDLYHDKAPEAHREELVRLRKLITQLISRTQLLSELLKNAGITVPAEPALEKISPLKWSNKINVVSGFKFINSIEIHKGGEKKKENLETNVNSKPNNIDNPDKQVIQTKCCSDQKESIIENQENHVDVESTQEIKKVEETPTNKEDAPTDSSSKIDIKNFKKVKRKKDNTVIATSSGISEINTVPRGTLLLSGGKLMPVVTPIQSLTSNIIVNAQAHPQNPIILNSAQQGQMIVVQPFQAVSAVQTVTLNTVPNIQGNVLINPKDWAKNIKTVVNSSKIGGTKGILPKIKEVTETTMTYKVPIPAIHKERFENQNKNKDPSLNVKHTKTKAFPKRKKIRKMSQNVSKSSKDDDKKDLSDVNKNQLKRTLESGTTEVQSVHNKKGKLSENDGESDIVHKNESGNLGNSVTCKSIENLKQVIEKIGDDASYTHSTQVLDDSKFTPEENKTENKPLEESVVDESNSGIPQDKKSNLISLDTSKKESIPTEQQSSSNLIDDEIINSNTSVLVEQNVEFIKTSVEKLEVKVLTPEGNMNENIILSNETNGNCNMGTKLDLLNSNMDTEQTSLENNKIFLNLDTHTTTTMQVEGIENKIDSTTSPTSNVEDSIKLKNSAKEDHNMMKAIPYSPSNSFVPINHKTDSMHSDLSNDIFASLQVPSSSNNSESISPTAAFLMAFPIVSSVTGKAEVLDEDMKDDFKYSSQTPPMLLQIGAIEPNNFKINSRTSSNDNLEISDSSGVNQQSPMKSTSETITSSPSTQVTTSVKTLPRVISSQTITESFKIIPVTSEQITRPNTAANNSVQVQTNSNENSSPVIPDKLERPINDSSVQNFPQMENKPPTNFNYTKSLTSSSNTNQNGNSSMMSINTERNSSSMNNIHSERKSTAMIINNQRSSLSNNLHNYPAESKPHSNFTFPKDALPNTNSNQSKNSSTLLVNNTERPVNSNNVNNYPIDNKSHGNFNFSKDPTPNSNRNLNKNSSTLMNNTERTVNSNNVNNYSAESKSHTNNFSTPANPNTNRNANTSSTVTSNNTELMHNRSVNNFAGENKSHNNFNAPLNSNSNRSENSSSHNTELMINRNVSNYAVENKPQSNFNYSKDMPLTSISSSIANDILNKYISSSSTSQATSTMGTETLSKYNSSSNYVSQNCQTSISNSTKENVNRSNSQFNFSCPSANDIPTDRDLCKLQICPMEAFTERSNEYSARSKENTFSNIHSAGSESLNKTVQMPTNHGKSSKNSVQNDQNMMPSSNSISTNTNSFQTSKKVDNKTSSSTLETNMMYHKKSHEMPQSSSYISACDNKMNKKMVTATSQSNHSGQKIIPSSRSNTYSQQIEPCIGATTYEDNNVTRSTTTTASTSTNFSILSWTTFSPLSSNNNNFPQYEPSSVSTDIPKSVCDNFNYLPLPKENVSLPNTLPQSSYPTADSQISNFDKSKTKLPVEAQKRPYTDVNKSRNMRVPQNQTISMQKSPRTHTQQTIPNSDYKYPAENKNKYKYPMDMDYIQNNYPNNLDAAPHLQHHQHNQQNHQASGSKTSQPIQSHKSGSDKSNYMLPDYNNHTNFNMDSNNLQPRYSNNHDAYSSNNFKYSEKNQQIHSKYQTTSQASTSTVHQDNSMYNNTKHMQHQSQSNQSKTKTDSSNQIQPTQQQQQQQQSNQQTMRPPVNWMMTPEIKHNSNITDIILPPLGKDLDFCQNNIFSQTPTYNQSSTNHQFYNNYDMSTHSFPNLPVLQSDSKRNIDTTYYPEEQTFSWSPTKSLSQNTEQGQSLKNLESSTMPTLVGDLALGTNIPDKQNFMFGQMPVRSGGSNDIAKDTLKDKGSNRDYQGIINPQNNQQHSSHGMPFLSVSQLVDHDKVDKNQHQQHHNATNHHHNSHQQHHHHHPPPQQQQPQQQSTRKQRKGSNSPRASAKRQMDMRQKQSSSNNSEQIHRQHEEPKNSSANPGFADNNYQQHPQQSQQQQQPQQQKYNQQNNDVQWRNRNCKSNYTAEALIGSNTSQSDNNQTEKNLSKYSSNYPQNKFPGSTLSSDPMSLNYFPNVDDTGAGYGQVMNQNFNHSYAYPSNYPGTNFIGNSNYMMPLHDNATDYLDGNNFLLTSTTPLLTDSTKNQHHQPYGPTTKQQTCGDKRLYFGQQQKKTSSKKKAEQNFDFPVLDDYHHASTFLAPPPNPLYPNQTNVYPKSTLPPPPPPPPPTATSSSSVTPSSQGGVTMAMSQHHPSGTSLTNFNLSTIFPEINDKVTGYKSSTNGVTQSTSHASTSYSQRANYSDPLGQMSQTSESTTHFNNTGSR